MQQNTRIAMKLSLSLHFGLSALFLVCSCEHNSVSNKPAPTKPEPTEPVTAPVPDPAKPIPTEPATTVSSEPAPEQVQKTMPKRKPFKPLTDEQLRKALTPLQYQVTQHEGTERPYTNKYDEHFEEGIYVCIISGEALFSSKDKYNSGCGWPAFTKPIDKAEIETNTDFKIGYARTEVRAKTGNSHLGHVFNDGPPEKGGRRYCINSASLHFIPKANLVEEGYGEYLHLFAGKKGTPE